MLQNGRPCIKEEIDMSRRLIGDSFSEGNTSIDLNLIMLPFLVYLPFFIIASHFINLEFGFKRQSTCNLFLLAKTYLLVLLF